LYQNPSVVVPVGAVNVCATEDAPLVGELDPSSAAYVPACGLLVVTPVAGPEAVQPTGCRSRRCVGDPAAAGRAVVTVRLYVAVWWPRPRCRSP